jgi:hypothetical protein
MSSLADERFDGMLLNIAQQSQGIEPLLDAVFSFLRRKTDFFSGAAPEVRQKELRRLLSLGFSEGPASCGAPTPKCNYNSCCVALPRW